VRALAFFAGLCALELTARFRDFAGVARLRAFGLAARLADFAFFATDLRDFAATARLRDFALVDDLRDFAFVAFFFVFAIAGLLPNLVRGCELREGRVPDCKAPASDWVERAVFISVRIPSQWLD
jgi:hypothetical protein